MHIELPSPPPPPYPHPPPLDNDNVIGTNQCLCLPKAELNTKNSTKRQLCCRLVEFLVFNSICQLIIVPSDGVNRGDLHKIFLILSGRRHVPLFKGYYVGIIKRAADLWDS